jgi:hypothetical protein
MIVDDLDVIAVTVPPHKTDTPSLVNTDRVLTGSPSPQGLQMIPGRGRKYLKLGRGVQLEQFSESHTLDCPEAPAVFVRKNPFGFSATKTLNYGNDIT